MTETGRQTERVPQSTVADRFYKNNNNIATKSPAWKHVNRTKQNKMSAK